MDTTARPGTNPLWGPDWPSVRDQWTLDPSVAFLNHGSFGACPRPVLDAQQGLRDAMERQPVEFLDRRLPGLISAARERAAEFLHADPACLAFVPNATTGVASVLASTALEPGDRVVITDHSYPAVRNAAHRACAANGARLVVRPVPLPLPRPDDIIDLVTDALTSRTKLLIIDHVTSPTAAVFPVDRIVRAARSRGVPVLVDAAHTPGMLDVDIGRLGPDFWTGNFHKWACAPKGAAVLYVAPARKDQVHPVVTSHGYGRGLHPEFDWTGTADPTPYLSIPAALDFMDGLGWDRLRWHNHSLVALGRDLLAKALRTPALVSDASFGSMAVVELPGPGGSATETATALQARLYAAERIEVPIGSWGGRGFVRLSAQAYNAPAEFERLARAFPSLLADADA